MKLPFAQLRALAALVGCCLCGQSASGAEPGFYVGINYAQVKKDAGKGPLDAFALDVYDFYRFAPAQVTSSLDTEDSGYGFVGGYRLFNYLAVEGGYMDLGEITYRNESTGTDLITGDTGTWNQKIDAGTSGFAVSALGILPLSYRSEVYVRAGVLLASNELKIFITDGIGSDDPRITESSTDLLAGVGAAFTVAEIYAIRLEYQRVFDAGDDSTGEADVDLLALGFTVTF